MRYNVQQSWNQPNIVLMHVDSSNDQVQFPESESFSLRESWLSCSRSKIYMWFSFISLLLIARVYRAIFIPVWGVIYNVKRIMLGVDRIRAAHLLSASHVLAPVPTLQGAIHYPTIQLLSMPVLENWSAFQQVRFICRYACVTWFSDTIPLKH